MPALTAKQIHEELKRPEVWPVYWIHGPERLKARELIARIRTTVLGKDAQPNPFCEDVLEGGECTASGIIDAAHTMSWGGGARFIFVKSAHALKEPDELASLLGPKRALADTPFVCVFESQVLDQRRTFSKQLLKTAACIACDPIPDAERGTWIRYLAERRGLALTEEPLTLLRALDPWSLDIVDQELAKLSLSDGDPQVISGVGTSAGTTERFLNALFTRKSADALAQIDHFARDFDQALPLVGLLTWNLRHLIPRIAARGAPTARVNPMVEQRLSHWSRLWTLQEILELEALLGDLDFSLKQSFHDSLGLWSALIQQTRPKEARRAAPGASPRA